MDVQDAIHKRRTIRRFLEIPIEWEKVGSILDAGRMSPSAGGLQCCRFIIIRSEASKKIIAGASLQQYWMGKAPLMIIVLADFKGLETGALIGPKQVGLRLFGPYVLAVEIASMLLLAIIAPTCWSPPNGPLLTVSMLID